MPSSVSHLLPQVSFSILFGLSVKPRHGYELLQQIRDDSAGHMQLGAGALYGTLKKLTADNLIEDMPFEGDPRRRYYRLTRAGWLRLNAELVYYERIARLARERHLVQPGS
ncbi:MAG TPA: PadR family transcriptional regulator [Bacillota bacterium]|nr:PadR family transcriptional regulator [Bacillota bacterium]